MNMANSWDIAQDRRERRKRRDALDPNKAPEVVGVEDAYKKAGGTGSLGAIPVEQTGYGVPAYDQSASYEEGYEEGGLIGEEPPVPIPPLPPSEPLPPYELPQDRLPPISEYPEQGRPVTPPGNSGSARRGVLPVETRETRTRAYDPETEGPGLSGPGLTGGASTVAAPPPDAGAAGAPAGTIKKTGSREVPYNPTAGGEGSSANAADDLQKAIDGGLQFATDAFHLKGDAAALPGTERNQQRGMQALAQGVGAADPQLVQAIDQKVNQIPGMKNDPGLWAIRRLEAIYRFYSRTGQSDKANKAAFELMQYSAGIAAKHGNAALELLKGGDQQGAIQQIVQGHNMIPDGRQLKVDGNKVTVVDGRTGEQVQTYNIKPQDVFNAALGLSNRSLYWDVLMHRAASTTKGRSTRSESQIELDKARTDLTRARTDKLKAGGKGGGGGTSPALQGLIDKIGQIDASRGVAPPAASPPGQSGARPPNAGGEGAGEEDLEDERDAGGDPAQGASPADSVMRLQPRPGRVAGTVEAPAAALAAPQKAPAADPDVVPDIEVFRDGSKYSPAAREEQPKPFDRPKPGANPYRPLLVDVAKIPGKEGVRARQLLTAKITAYDKEAGSWDKDRKEHIASEQRRVKEEGVRTREDQKAKMRDAYDYKPRPPERKQLMLDVNEAVDEAVKTIKTKDVEKKTKVFDNSIFVDEKVPAGTLKNLVYEVMTSNPLPDANRGLAIVSELTRVDDEDESARQYKPRGKDVLGNIVVQTQKYGPVHLRPKAAEDIFAIARRRAAEAVARRNTPPTPSRLEAPMKRFGEAIDDRAGEAPADAAKRARRTAPASPTADLEP